MKGLVGTTSAGSLHHLHHAGNSGDELEAPLVRGQVPESNDLDISQEGPIFKALNWRLLPLFWLMVVLCYIDRTNLSFAAIQLAEDRGLTPEVFGLGSGLFFVTYATLQIPSNIVLKRVGGPLWLATIIAAWGACACSFAAMRTHAQFYALRTLLGLAEAGAFPGMWFMLSKFYPSDRITLAYAVVESGISLSHTIAGPLAASCLSLSGLGGLRGWQWLFLLEGAPSILLALAMATLLPASPDKARFLSEQQRTYLSARVGAHGERGSGAGSTREALWHAGSNRAVWYMGIMKILHDTAAFGIIFFTPMMVQALLRGEALNLDAAGAGHGAHGAQGGHGDAGITAALITSIPFGCAAVVSFWIAHRSQREGERIGHTGWPYLVCGALFTAFPLLAARSPLAGFLCLAVGVVGVYAGSAPALSLVTDLAAGPGLVVALPMYNALGNIGGFVGPTLIGYMLTTWRSFAAPTVLMGSSLAAAGAMVLLMPASLRGKAKSATGDQE
mmetsp:Transcript_23433/g.60001  ORF Transcript_23433/g.60001 Transcript_23433/m.60001 type:complete len:502 (-) Transcript_23433:214-1719(-)|eukprot:CAMPEP_0202857972 /NCGR_PEP_ID=MMETSP1391-20130828/696_1 /ASSEMBLY_ACC=CAM_ASM_000867 /TAXON_ID=1034604 /ORGANISM="Chlamydomonas leiostraca, Strain SAG 11-49" /LENGTH=501 /DNA_ID=CAMNT_0049536837 /DNA_START=165 /DNA_END=1670 /DNA_ORIENTATION=+